jgi:hypothetical protein
MFERIITHPLTIVAVSLATILIVSLAIYDNQVKYNEDVVIEDVPAKAAPINTAIDQGLINSWQNYARRQGLTVENFEHVYLKDKNLHTVLLVEKNAEGAKPRYEIIIEDKTFRIMGFGNLGTQELGQIIQQDASAETDDGAMLPHADPQNEIIQYDDVKDSTSPQSSAPEEEVISDELPQPEEVPGTSSEQKLRDALVN